jgi:hypothetical protein
MINPKQKVDVLSYWNYFFLIPIALIGGYLFFYSVFICNGSDFNYSGQCFGTGLSFTLFLVFSVPINFFLFLLGMIIKKQREKWPLTLILAGAPIILLVGLWFFEL